MHAKRIVGSGLAALAVAGTAAALAHPATADTPAADPTTTVVANKLDVPKYLTVRRDGLYVAESGVGGDRCTDVIGVPGQPTQACTGATGKVRRIDFSGGMHTVVRGLASTREADTGEIQGPIAVTFDHGRPLVVERGAFVGPNGRSVIPGRLGRQFGKLLATTARGETTRVYADLARAAYLHPQPAETLGGLPGETTYDSDVHDVVRYRGGYAFPDAGANDVVWRDRYGKLSVIARLPTTPERAPAGFFGPGSPAQTVQAQAVPSAVTVGPDGALYVATLGGQPSLPGTANVYRVGPGKAPVRVVGGLDRASDLAFDPRGRLLVLETKVGGAQAPDSAPGAIVRATLRPGRVVRAGTLPVSGLSAPSGLAVTDDGTVYVSNRTTTPGHGEVVRISGLD